MTHQIDADLHRRWLHDPEFHAKVNIIASRLYGLRLEIDPVLITEAALLVARDLYPDQAWVEHQTRRAEAVRREMEAAPVWPADSP